MSYISYKFIKKLENYRIFYLGQLHEERENCVEPTDDDCKDVPDYGAFNIYHRWPCNFYIFSFKFFLIK